jgi:AcrR family transcriptional regulator
MRHPTEKLRGDARGKTRLSGAQAEEQLIQAASELFYAKGVRAIGIDAVIERAGVNKMSLYRRFTSKEDLVVAYLERMDDAYWRRFGASIAKHPGEPARQLVQILADLAERASEPAYRGCPFVNVSCEFDGAEHRVRQVVSRNKTALFAQLVELARQAGAKDPQALASGLALLIEGVYTASQTYGAGSAPVRTAPALAEQLVRVATGDEHEWQ